MLGMKKVILPEMIDYFRKQKGWTMKELGVRMNKTESAISKWISGARSPMVDDLDKLVDLFDTDIKTLTYGGDNSYSSTLDQIITIVDELEPDRQNITLGFVTAQLSEQKSQNRTKR